MSRKRTRFEGVYQRESTTRRHQGRRDVYYEITFKHDGKKVWEKVGWASEGYTAAMAHTVRGERMRELRHGEKFAASPAKKGMTLDQAWQHYETHWLATSTKSQVVDRCRYNKHLAHLAAKPLSSISPFDVEKLKIGLLGNGLSEQSVRHVMGLLARIYNKIISWKLWSGENPVTSVKRPSRDNKRHRYLTAEEAHTLLASLALRSAQTHDMALTSLHTGLRFGEIAALTWESVDLSSRTLRAKDTKNGESRAVYITDEMAAMLTAKHAGNPSDLVFPGRDQKTGGTKIMDAVSATYERTVADLGLNDAVTDPRGKVVFHTLRHTFASWMVMEGVPLSEVGELLGHSDLEMTRRYAHLAPEKKRQAVGSMERVFRTAGHESAPPARKNIVRLNRGDT
jgi:integrase